jgi:hypothetical protein
MLFRLNLREKWRNLLGIPEPDLHIKDVEFLLRAFAVLVDDHSYAPSMNKFLNGFSKKAKAFNEDFVVFLEGLFDSFLAATSDLDDRAFKTAGNRFSITVFESVFYGATKSALDGKRLVRGKVDPRSVQALRDDADFNVAANRGTTSTSNVQARLRLAKSTIRVS